MNHPEKGGLKIWRKKSTKKPIKRMHFSNRDAFEPKVKQDIKEGKLISV
jgi:hypothetical protein